MKFVRVYEQGMLCLWRLCCIYSFYSKQARPLLITVFSKLSSSFRVVVEMQLYLKNTDKEKFDVLQ